MAFRKIMKPCGFHCIKINNLGVSFGEQTVLEDVNLHIHCGSITAIIGRNGAGKSTLVRAILGEMAHTGDIEFRNTENGVMSNLRIGYVPQTVNIENTTPLSVYDLFVSYTEKLPV
ncbi:MAG: ATP-binding cassette domain-containing protein, partial [Pseudobutyrivibrio sp.]|nr:ATP-binding cassette domain-containing protein [Pseudobutyrivibrio sp.]MCF0187023.1 ATP-binding cassette domain-containing protein [Bacteroidaceae bacterium]